MSEIKIEDIKEPADLGIKIGTKEESAWTTIKERAEEEILQSKRVMLIDQEIVKLAEMMIKVQQEVIRKA